MDDGSAGAADFQLSFFGLPNDGRCRFQIEIFAEQKTCRSEKSQVGRWDCFPWLMVFDCRKNQMRFLWDIGQPGFQMGFLGTLGFAEFQMGFFRVFEFSIFRMSFFRELRFPDFQMRFFQVFDLPKIQMRFFWDSKKSIFQMRFFWSFKMSKFQLRFFWISHFFKTDKTTMILEAILIPKTLRIAGLVASLLQPKQTQQLRTFQSSHRRDLPTPHKKPAKDFSLTGIFLILNHLPLAQIQ